MRAWTKRGAEKLRPGEGGARWCACPGGAGARPPRGAPSPLGAVLRWQPLPALRCACRLALTPAGDQYYVDGCILYNAIYYYPVMAGAWRWGALSAGALFLQQGVGSSPRGCPREDCTPLAGESTSGVRRIAARCPLHVPCSAPIRRDQACACCRCAPSAPLCPPQASSCWSHWAGMCWSRPTGAMTTEELLRRQQQRAVSLLDRGGGSHRVRPPPAAEQRRSGSLPVVCGRRRRRAGREI